MLNKEVISYMIPYKGMSSNANGRPLGLGITTVLSHTTLPWCKETLLSIPSHCTMGEIRRTGIVPRCPTCFTLYLLYHCCKGDYKCDVVVVIKIVAYIYAALIF